MIDETSQKILTILQKKARIPNAEVARQVGLAPSAVLERIRKLEQQGLIDGYEVRLNPQSFNLGLVAFIFVKTSSEAHVHEIGTALSRIPETQEVHHVSGEDGYMLKVRTANSESLGQLIQDKILTLKGVTATRTHIVFSTRKETLQFPISTHESK